MVVSVDPQRIYVKSPITSHTTIKTHFPGPNQEEYCWYQCTVKGGREARDIDVVQLARSVELLGAGEILLNCMDMDGRSSGYDLELLRLVRAHVRIPIIASSGAGCCEHFVEAFENGADGALAAGIFHRDEVKIAEVKQLMRSSGFDIRE